VLLACGASPHLKDSQGRTALSLCTSNEHIPLREALLSAGATLESSMTVPASTSRELLLRLPSLGPVTGTLTPRVPVLGLEHSLTSLTGTPLINTPRAGMLAPIAGSTPRSLNGSLHGFNARPPSLRADSTTADTSRTSCSEMLSSTDDEALSSRTSSSSDGDTVLDRSSIKQQSTKLVGSFTARQRESKHLCDASDSDEEDREGDEARCFVSSVRTERLTAGEEKAMKQWADEAIERSGVWDDMDGEMDDMEAALIEAKARSEGMRAQCNALRMRGAHQDVMLDKETTLSIPKLNFGALSQKADKPGFLGNLMEKVKQRSANVTPRNTSSSGRRVSAVSISVDAPSVGNLPTIQCCSSEDCSSDSDSDAMVQPLSSTQLYAPMTAQHATEHILTTPKLPLAASLTPRSRRATSSRPVTTRPVLGYAAISEQTSGAKCDTDEIDALLGDLSF